MSDETPPTPPASPPASPSAAAPPSEPMVSAALLEQARAEATELRTRLGELEPQLQTLTSERETLAQQVTRLTVRQATGIDDDQIADMAHARYSQAIEGQDNAPGIGDWWKSLAGNEEAAAALPKALRVYLQPAEPAAAPTRGAPSAKGKTTPPAGTDGKLTPDQYARMSGGDRRQVHTAFLSDIMGRRYT